MPKSDEWQDFISNHNSKFQHTNLISDSSREKTSFSKDIYLTKGQLLCYSKKLHSTITSVEALFSNQREADQKIPNHVMFAISPESSVCLVSDDIDIYILMLYIAKNCNGNLYSPKEGIMYHQIKPLAIQFSDKICNILPVFHGLTRCDYTNPFIEYLKFKVLRNMPET